MGARRLIVAGSREWEDVVRLELVIRAQVDEWIRHEGLDRADLTIVHGDCPTGADRMADQWARRAMVRVERFPADWDRFGRGAGPVRNKAMAKAGADAAIVFVLDGPDAQGRPRSRGTHGLVGLLKEHGIPVDVVQG